MKPLLIIPALLFFISCGNQNKVKINEQTEKLEEQQAIPMYPRASNFVESPVRNRLTLELNRPVSEVYALVGDPGNMPKYSAGLEKVETESENGRYSSYTCYFKTKTEDEEGLVHTEAIVWQEVNQGWASMSHEPDEFGFTDYFSLTTLEDKGNKTLLQWYMHYNHESLEMIKMNASELVDVFDDMGNQLIAKFGGKVVENFVKPNL